jgi:hypothetical protein
MQKSVRERKGCDLQEQCGLFCRYMHGEAATWRIMVEKYCEGPDYALCARRIFFSKTGECAPLDMTPVGTLPKHILDDLFKLG